MNRTFRKGGGGKDEKHVRLTTGVVLRLGSLGS